MGEEQKSRESKEKADNKQGIFVTKGMQVTIPEGGLTLQIGPDGKPRAELKALHLELDLCLYWLEIAVDHLVSAEQANAAALAAHKSGDSKQKAEALEAEFTSGMQAIVASAIAIDAFYAAIKERAAISNIDELSRTWREKGTARYKQIAEVMRRAFSLQPEPFQALRSNLKELMNYRGKAVHPPSGATKPMMHPELNQPTEWRFVVFRFVNAKALVGFAITLVAQTASQHEGVEPERFQKYCRSLAEKIGPLVESWEKRYGQLIERSNPN